MHKDLNKSFILLVFLSSLTACGGDDSDDGVDDSSTGLTLSGDYISYIGNSYAIEFGDIREDASQSDDNPFLTGYKIAPIEPIVLYSDYQLMGFTLDQSGTGYSYVDVTSFNYQLGPVDNYTQIRQGGVAQSGTAAGGVTAFIDLGIPVATQYIAEIEAADSSGSPRGRISVVQSTTETNFSTPASAYDVTKIQGAGFSGTLTLIPVSNSGTVINGLYPTTVPNVNNYIIFPSDMSVDQAAFSGLIATNITNSLDMSAFRLVADGSANVITAAKNGVYFAKSATSAIVFVVSPDGKGMVAAVCGEPAECISSIAGDVEAYFDLSGINSRSMAYSVFTNF